MRVQLLCDQKWRDLPNLAAIKVALEAHGHRVLVSTIKDAAPIAIAFRPDCVVFNHILSPGNRKLAASLRANSVAVVVLPTEGAMRPERRSLAAGEFAESWPMDLYLAWSEPAAKAVRARWGLDQSAVRAIGCTRFDFYTPAFDGVITSREAFCRQHDLDPARPIVTWASAYGFADVESRPAVHAQFLKETAEKGIAECYRRVGLDPARIPSVQSEGRQAAASALMTMAAARPRVQFVLRPHPNENRNFYRSLIAEHGLQNVRFCPQDYIWNVLRATSVHLHRHCTTAIEAWLWDKPTVEMAMDPMPHLGWPDREAASDMAFNADELMAIVDRYLEADGIDHIRRNYRRDYVRTWFGNVDGQRCRQAANAIDGLLRACGRRRHALTSMSGITVPPRQVAAAVVRYGLGRRPNEPLFSRLPAGSIDPRDKQITRCDVRDYTRIVAPAVS